MDNLQGVIMNIIQLKNGFRFLVAIFLLFNSSQLLAGTKIPFESNTEQKATQKAEQKIIHLNDSTLAQLKTLKGIGHKKAVAIVAYREKIGTFKSIDELIKVKGVGKKVINDNRGRLAI